MAVKVITISLMLWYFCLCVTGKTDNNDNSNSNSNSNNNSDSHHLEITEEEYNQFQGIDPLKNCNNPDAMKKMCNGLGKPAEAKDFFKDYPACETYDMELKTKCGGKVVKKTKFLICGWVTCDGTNTYIVYGKGQTAGTCMNYEVDCNGVHHPYSDFEVQGGDD